MGVGADGHGENRDDQGESSGRRLASLGRADQKVPTVRVAVNANVAMRYVGDIRRAGGGRDEGVRGRRNGRRRPR